MVLPDNLDDTKLATFIDDIRGKVIQPGDESYDDARTVWNATINREPSLIVHCRGTADVITVLNFVREHDLPFSVKGTGHNVAGTAVRDDGVVIDLSLMNAVWVDPDAKTARVQPGTTWGDLDHETQAFGLATPGAQAPSVGIIGAMLGGGIGWLSRKYGLTVDNVLSADIVTADGRLVHASNEENPELFWGVLGGSGNFGIVVSIHLRLHEVGPDVLAGSLIHPLEDARAVTRHYRDFMVDASEEVTTLLAFLQLSSAPHIPQERHGERAVMVGVCYAGDPKEGKTVLAPVREFGYPIVDTIRRRRYVEWQSAGASEEVARTYQNSHYFEDISDGAIDTIVEFVSDVPSLKSSIFIVSHSGAVTDVSTDATAYPHRNASYLLVNEARWDDPARDDEHITWARESFEALRPYSTGGVWVNALTDLENEERIRSAYGDNYDQLVELKGEWDPENLFQMNHNIELAN